MKKRYFIFILILFSFIYCIDCNKYFESSKQTAIDKTVGSNVIPRNTSYFNSIILSFKNTKMVADQFPIVNELEEALYNSKTKIKRASKIFIKIKAIVNNFINEMEFKKAERILNDFRVLIIRSILIPKKVHTSLFTQAPPIY